MAAGRGQTAVPQNGKENLLLDGDKWSSGWWGVGAGVGEEVKVSPGFRVRGTSLAAAR